MFSKVPGAGANVDMTSHTKKVARKVVDPLDQFVTDDPTRPTAAAETAGPHRYSIVVPKDDSTVFSLGQGVGPISTGITLSTATTIQAYILQREGQFTSLVLGAPPVVGSDANLATAGYSMTTAGGSVHEAKGRVLLRSSDDAVGIVAKNNIVAKAGRNLAMSADGAFSLETTKSLKINAGTPAGPVQASFGDVLKAIPYFIGSAADFVQPAAAAHSESAGKAAETVASVPDYLGLLYEGGEELHAALLQRHAKAIDKVLVHLAATGAIILAATKLREEVQEGETVFGKVAPLLEWGKSIYEEIEAVVTDLTDSKSAPEGSVSITAQANVEIEAVDTMSIGASKTSINGYQSFSASGIKASITGHKDGSVWGGMTASLKALMGEVAIATDLGNVSITGRKAVKMTSQKDAAVVTGMKTAQLNSTEEKAYIHGKEGVVLGGGTGSGFGVVADGDRVRVGAISGVDKLQGAKIHGAEVAVDGFGISLRTSQSDADTRLKLFKMKTQLNTTTLDVDATQVTLNGKVIYLG
jgi:hypothetical protein